MTDDERKLAALHRYIEHSGTNPELAHEMYADDAVLEFPQSGERFAGKGSFLEWRRLYPADVEFEVRRVRGGGALWVVEILLRYDKGEWQHGVSILEFRDGLVAHETIYGAPPWDAPAWRAPWRAAEPAGR